MVKSWHKYLNKLALKQQITLKNVIYKLICLDFCDLDIEKINGEKYTYRCGVGNIRIIYEKIDTKIVIKKIGPRGDIYK